MDEFDFSTLAVHAGEEADPETGAMRLPIDMATTFKLPPFGPKLIDALMLDSPQPPHAYTRWSNPTLRALEERLTALETVSLPGAKKKKIDAVVTASGMAAVSALLLTLLSKGDHVVASEVCYAGSVELFGQHLPRFGIEVSLVDTSDLEQVQAAMRPNTRLVYAETPANPILRISDIAALAGIAHAAGVPLAVDSTWASPALQQPLALGADFVIHSLTKYINGHGDALGGVVIGPQKQIQRIRKEMLVHLGGALSPFNAWLILRGAVTLPLRMQQHSHSALQVAQFLESHPKVNRVVYPGLESHPHHALAQRQMSALRRDADLPVERRPGGSHHPFREDQGFPLRHLARACPQPAVLLSHGYVHRPGRLSHTRSRRPPSGSGPVMGSCAPASDWKAPLT